MFVFGLGVVYLTIFYAFPYLNDKLPLALALLALYCFLAYITLPLFLRVRQALLRPSHIPLYAITPDGWPSDPVNIAVVAHSKHHLISTMKKAGWYVTDKATIRNMAREAWAIVFNKPYPTAPFSNLYLFGRPYDIGFQCPRDGNLSPRTRHHVRFWRLQVPKNDKHLGHYQYWRKRLRHLFGTGSQVWIGAASDDIHPFGFQWRNGKLTHRVDPDTDTERDFIVGTLDETDLVKHTKTIRAGEPFTFRGQQLHHKIVCDGTIRVVTLENPLVSSVKI